ncbi:hypothetical protein BDF14DRAFT_1998641, partial [Spinellus fusiger]
LLHCCVAKYYFYSFALSIHLNRLLPYPLICSQTLPPISIPNTFLTLLLYLLSITWKIKYHKHPLKYGYVV